MSDEVLWVHTRDDAARAWRLFEESDRFLAFDTETTGLQVRSVHGDKARTIQFSWRPWNFAVVFETNGRWKDAIGAFFDGADELVGHNTNFDLHVMETYLDRRLIDEFDPRKVHDTKVISRLHDERDQSSLKPQASKYLSEDAADEQTKLKRIMGRNKWTWATVPVEYLIEYGGTDAIITGRLYDTLRPRIDYAEDAYLREQRVAPVLYRMERAGMLVDRDLLEELQAEEFEAMEKAEAEVQNYAPGVNVNAPHQLKAAFRDLGIDLENTKAATLYAVDHPLAHAILKYRDHKKTHGTYISSWLELITPEDRIHPSFNSLGTITGRLSSSDPNFQNVSKTHRLRDVFVASPGCKIVVADWNQVELRLYAHFAQDENMRAAFLAGDDIYQQAADLLGVPRQVGKMMMLASIYGAGWLKIRSQAIEMAYKYGQADTVPELKSYDWRVLHNRFHRIYKIRDLSRLTELAARRREMYGEGYIRTVGGRRQRPKYILLPPVNGHRQRIPSYKDLANSLVQGSSADLMKEALIAIDDLGYGDYLRLTVHDEVVMEVPEDEVEEVQEAVIQAMTRNEFVPPLTVEADSADNYGAAK